MARKNQNKALGCLMLLVLLIGGGIAAVKTYPVIAIPVGLLSIILIANLLKPKRCEVCNNQIKRNSYKWEIDGQSTLVCVPCNQSLSRKQSKRAIDKRFN
jgi:hypothetical protein